MSCNLFLVLLCSSACVFTMDIDDTQISSTKPTQGNASSESTDMIILSKKEKELCAWTMQEMATQNSLIKKYAKLTYPKGITASSSKEKIEYKREAAADVTENRTILEQNNYIYIANHLTLLLEGTSKSEFSGNSQDQTARLQQVQDDLKKLFKVNETVFKNTEDTIPEPPRKKQKHT